MAGKKHEEILERLRRRASSRERLLEPEALDPKGYRMMGVSLYTPEAEWVDHLVSLLKKAGIRRANRSLVIQHLLLYGKESLDGKNPEDLARFFRERIARRI